MDFPAPLRPARLIRRYKRFLADIRFDDGTEDVAHCPNPGSMMGLADPGARIWVMPAGPGKKLGWSWKLTELEDGHLAGIDTAMPNRVVGEGLRAGLVPSLAGYGEVRSEVAYGTASRVDFLLTGPVLPTAYVEVKNVHLRREGTWAEFPDCVTTRGAKHLRELTDMVAAGHRAVMLYLVQRTDCDAFRLAADLDPGYAAAFDAARAAGVEMIAHGTAITHKGVSFGAEVPVDPAPQAFHSARDGLSLRRD